MTSKSSVNVYDFDHTIYDGDISLDFIVYCISHHTKTWKYAPRMALATAAYILDVWPRKKVKEEIFSILNEINDIDIVVEKFWQKACKNIKPWYPPRHNDSDIIISASPEFLINPLYNLFPIKVIGTVMNPKTGKISGDNCHGDEKVNRLRTYSSLLSVNNCYSDSLTDRPLLNIAAHPFIVKGASLIPMNQYKSTPLSKLKSRAFMRFLLIGGVNALLGILFSYSFSLLIGDPIISFLIGYSLGLTVSYPINGLLVFRDFTPSAKQFIRFCLSYVPNFCIQLVSVYVLINLLGLPPLGVYVLAVIIAIPITFLLLLYSTFNKEIKS